MSDDQPDNGTSGRARARRQRIEAAVRTAFGSAAEAPFRMPDLPENSPDARLLDLYRRHQDSEDRAVEAANAADAARLAFQARARNATAQDRDRRRAEDAERAERDAMAAEAETAAQFLATPAAGSIGIALKLRFLFRSERDGGGWDQAARISRDFSDGLSIAEVAAVLLDAERLAGMRKPGR